MSSAVLTVDLGQRSYPIMIGSDWLSGIAPALRERTETERVLVVTDSNVGNLYGDKVSSALGDVGFSVETLRIPAGEQSKTMDTCMSLYNFMLSNNFSREAVVVALGGGVVGDLAGFCAATYMRGVSYVQAPTSLLAMVDSSVGGKTGVNHSLGKNMIGAFHQPMFVYVDLQCLETLAKDEFRAGFAEVIKYGVIRDSNFFNFCENQRDAILNLDMEALLRVVKTSCEIKADIVSEDERESGVRTILNFGHTIGHAIESLTNYSQFKHGEAVAIGMIATGRLAVQMERFDAGQQERLEKLIVRSGLPARIPARLDAEDIVDRLRKDKKVQRGQVRFVLPEAIGRVVVESDVSPILLRDVLAGMQG